VLSESPALALDEATLGLGCLPGVNSRLRAQSREVLRALVQLGYRSETVR